MANNKSAPKRGKSGLKHQLLVYRFIAHRYRPAAILLFIMGLVLILPWFIPQLRATAGLDYKQLGYLGVAVVFAGAGLWILTIFMEKQAYVRCKPNFLYIHTMSHGVKLPYDKIVSIQSVQVARAFDTKSIKGRDKSFIKPLAGETAIEVEVSNFPKSEKTLHRDLNRFLFATRVKGFILIVPMPMQLSVEINKYTQEALDTRSAEQQKYLNPIERLKYQGNNPSK